MWFVSREEVVFPHCSGQPFKALEHRSAQGVQPGLSNPSSARALHPPRVQQGLQQQDGHTQEGESLVLVWRLSSPSEEHKGIIFSATSTWKGDMGDSLLQIAHCYHPLKDQRF